MQESTIKDSPFLLDNSKGYIKWRDEKLAHYPVDIEHCLVNIRNPYQVTAIERAQLQTHWHKTNLALYQITAEQPVDKAALLAFTQQFGLVRLDHNPCSDEEGVTTLQVTTAKSPHEYIPYTDRPINWHTDGYYNPLTQQVNAILLHCVQPALTGGSNMLLDHEIAYIQLRDKNPDYIHALMADDVMTIPENIDTTGQVLRSAQTGPVFSVDAQTGALHMRYTARTRSIRWKQDPMVEAALAYLTQLLNTDSPYRLHYRLAPHQGILCNNVLHNRAGFTNGATLAQQRLFYRMRFYDRIAN